MSTGADTTIATSSHHHAFCHVVVITRLTPVKQEREV